MKGKKKIENPICKKEVSKNFKGCIEVISKEKKWDFVEVRGLSGDGSQDVESGVIMGEPRFIEFINKAIHSYYGGEVIMKIMKDVMNRNGEGGKPTTH